jgi:hypothetical protein
VTEKKWLSATEPLPLIDHLEGLRWNRTKAGRRKLRLFGCACCRRVWRLTANKGRRWIEQAERMADGHRLSGASPPRPFHLGTISGHPNKQALGAAHLLLDTNVLLASATVCRITMFATGSEESLLGGTGDATLIEEREQARLARDIFGNPFRPVAFDPRWRSESAVALARTAYDTRDFTLLPILADALEEAGCDHADVLAHCRDPNGVHVRGCWVVDGVLGKQ